MNDKEMVEKARCAVTANARKRTIAVVDRTLNKEFGPFDKVYGPSAKQLDIYLDLVEPLVKNVLAGYNCTLFAYGQTSTGKTFTMEGEHPEQEQAWNDDSSVGVIPRALQHIFTELENQDAEEFSVRVSYVELYNEELYDLLGHGELGHARLRLFEDSVRKGSVIVSGLEEVPVGDRFEVHDLLKRGAEKRRKAATQMNLNSSRSHTVFTITVVIRENTVSGEEVIKQGKLSLIDLAGSENIGRSGSVDKRAREAGSINQSLLTLGRVIMALTSGSSHVPYRESKLTRILQDSLGGKTITTIVATLSPASTNVEESSSTLEYASSAKNIKNQPEINQKLTHRALLKAYNEEMNRLMRDLQAARDKTGFFVDRQNYEDMHTQLAQQNQQIETLTDELQSYIERVQLLMQDAELMGEHYGRLYKRYKHMEEKYVERCNENAQLNLELAECKSSLKNHRSVLTRLHEAAKKCEAENAELRMNCTNLALELCKAHDKIDAFQNAASENEKIYAQCAGGHEQSAEKLKSGIKSWNHALRAELQTLMDSCKQTKADVGKDMDAFRNFSKSLRSQLANYFSERMDGADDTSVVSFLKDVERFVIEADRCHAQIYEQHNKFSDFLLDHIKNYERLAESFRAANSHYGNSSVRLAENMKCVIIDALEKYVNETKEEMQLTNEKVGMLKTEHMSTCEKERSFCQTSLDLAASNAAAWKALEASFLPKIILQNQQVEETVKATNGLCGDLEVRSEMVYAKFNETADFSAGLANRQVERSEEASSSLLKEVIESNFEIKKFVEKKIVRPPTTGNTPKRVRRELLPESVKIPDVGELLNKGKESEPPRRLSQFRSRDSILETPFAVLSPDALKGTLHELDDIHETSENTAESDDTVGRRKDAAEANITKRRRALQKRNS